MSPRLPFTAVLLVAMLGDAAAADRPRYREGQPEVMTPRPVQRVDASAEAAAQLRAALIRARHPRFVLLWNRELSDRVVTEYEGFVRGDADVRHSRNGSSYSEEVRVGTQAIREHDNPTLRRRDDWQVRGAFETWLINASLVLVDRSTLVRQEGKSKTGSRPNEQSLEMDAISKGADYLLEVNAVPAAGKPAGALFRVVVKKVSDGRTIAAFTSEGRAVAGTSSHYVATDEGYQKVSDVAEVTIDDTGRQLAIELAHSLAGVL